MEVKTVSGHPFCLFKWLISGFFLSSVKMQTYQDQTVPKDCNLSRKAQMYQHKMEGNTSRSYATFFPVLFITISPTITLKEEYLG